MNAKNTLKNATITLASLLVLGAWQPSWAGGTADSKKDTAIENASTPAQHEALAANFRAKAAEAREVVKRHEAMKQSYDVLRRKESVAVHMAQHCDALLKAAQTEATEYDALAAGHAEMAKKAAGAK